MAVNIIVIAVTLLMTGFVAVWLLYPRCRPWIEAPKWQPLDWDPAPSTPDDGTPLPNPSLNSTAVFPSPSELTRE